MEEEKAVTVIGPGKPGLRGRLAADLAALGYGVRETEAGLVVCAGGRDCREGSRRFEVQDAFDDILHASPEIEKTLSLVSVVAPTDAIVLISGESGTGKELIARAIHRNSMARTGPFVPVNCSAIPETLLENELFGHIKGSYTDARCDKKGIFEFANGGTLFLDEISETSLALQVKLLRAIELSEIRRVGDTHPIKVSCRVIAASNKDLAGLARSGKFREDLYYRLNVFPIFVPPLRSRPADIDLLARHFLEQTAKRLGKPKLSLSRTAIEDLQRRPWPGNVRELQHFMERLVLLNSGPVIMPSQLPDKDASPAQAPPLPEPDLPRRRNAAPEGEGLAQAEKAHILRVYEECGRSATKAARRLSISRTTLWRKLRLYGLAVAAFLVG
ncbi:MAG: sigma 54-interacting transcriptional regulator [Elusimicrobia bacterium]|nr:sigma 54-interacting transcriptional regulator [Elusimicrobiota bacterium]MDE2426127.1 sigma 54-interacting transcriptional regulator [Elusimicrobiota bacterium]